MPDQPSEIDRLRARINELEGEAAAEAHHGYVAGARAALDWAAKHLKERAEHYQRLDGTPGPRGYNCWGWRDIAKVLNHEAAAILARNADPPQPPL